MRYDLKDLSIDTELRTVDRNGMAVKLPELSFDVLVALIEAAPDPLGTNEFTRGVWRAEHVSDETVAQRIALLRKALGDDPKNPTYIRTVRGAGYAIIGQVIPNEIVQVPGSKLSPSGRSAILIVAGAVTFLLFGALVLSNHNTTAKFPVSVNAGNLYPSVSILVQRAEEQLDLHQARETDRAIDMLENALALDPQDFDARLTYSFALTTRGTKFGGPEREKQEAETIARSLIEEQPDNSSAWSALGYALDAQGRSTESLPAYQTAYRLNPQNAPALSSAAYTLLSLGDLYEALVLELKVTQSGRNSRYSEIQIAQIMELIDHPSATDWYARALSLNPGQVVILSEIARSHLRRGDPYAALEILDQAEGDDKSAPSILQLRGRAAIALGNIEEARTYMEAASDWGYFGLLALDATHGDAAQTKEILRHKLTKIEDNTWPGYRIHLAEVSAALGEEDEALAFVKQAINLGWRDVDWLKQSPFLGALMQSNEGRKIAERIERELDAQRRLILTAEELAPVIDG